MVSRLSAPTSFSLAPFIRSQVLVLFLFFASQSSAGQGRSQSPRADPIGFTRAKIIVEGPLEE